ncbi:hypothetical protein ACI797_10365 [Geodermatophilus sp. SYSU D00691]
MHRLARVRTDEAEDDGALAEALAGLSAADQELLRLREAFAARKDGGAAGQVGMRDGGGAA